MRRLLIIWLYWCKVRNDETLSQPINTAKKKISISCSLYIVYAACVLYNDESKTIKAEEAPYGDGKDL